MLEEKSKILRWVVDKVPFLGDIESFCTEFVGYFEDIFLEYKTVEADNPIPNEQSSLEKKLKTENSSDSEKQRAIKTLEQTTGFTGERYEVGLLWREDEVRLTNNFYSAMGQLKSLEQRLQKDDTLRKLYHDTTKLPMSQASMVLATSSCHQPSSIWDGQKSVQRSSKLAWCSPQW